jgi:hypothetical protein
MMDRTWVVWRICSVRRIKGFVDDHKGMQPIYVCMYIFPRRFAYLCSSGKVGKRKVSGVGGVKGKGSQSLNSSFFVFLTYAVSFSFLLPIPLFFFFLSPERWLREDIYVLAGGCDK